MSVTHVTPLILFSFCFGTRKLVGASRNVLWNVLRLNNVCKRKQLYDENNLTSLMCLYDEAKKIMLFCFIDNTIVTIVLTYIKVYTHISTQEIRYAFYSARKNTFHRRANCIQIAYNACALSFTMEQPKTVSFYFSTALNVP